MNQGGDVLARGGKSATFGPPKVSQEKWDEIFQDKKDFDIGGPPNIHLKKDNKEK